MTRRHFEAIAGIISSARDYALLDPQEVIDKVEADLIYLFTKENPRFDADRFRAASGISD